VLELKHGASQALLVLTNSALADAGKEAGLDVASYLWDIAARPDP
jgi:hypothetical protein